jgi:hypothetical protein
VQENKRLSCLKGKQEEWLLELEKAARILGEQVGNAKEGVKSTKNDHTIIQETLKGPNPMLKEQLAQLQDDNMKLTIALQLEQNIKKELTKKLGQLQENLDEFKAFLELNSREAPSLQEE